MQFQFKNVLLVMLFAALMMIVIGCGSENTSGSNSNQSTNTSGSKAGSSSSSSSNSSSESAKPEFTLKFGHSNEPTEDSWYHLYALEFEKFVEENSNGRIEVEIYPAAQLGGEQEMVQSLSLGTLDATEAAATNFAAVVPQLGFFNLPYMFDSIDQTRAVINELMPWMQETSSEHAGIRVLGVADAGFRVLSSNDPVESLEDLKKMKIRVPNNPIMIGAYDALGAATVPLSWPETYTGLQQGVADAQDNPYNAILAARLYEVQNYITATDYLVQSNVIAVSDQFYNSLPADLQEVIDNAGKAVVQFALDLTDEYLVSDKEKLEGHGMVLLDRPSDFDEWVERGRSIHSEFYATIGDGDAESGKEILQTVNDAKEKVGK